MKLQFGPSLYKKQGFTTVDIDKKYQPDVVLDMDEFPYPFKDESVDEIDCCHVLEHLHHPLQAMDEFHRILKPYGLLTIEFPHHSRNWAGCGVFPHSHVCSIPYDIMDFYGSRFNVIKYRIEWLRRPDGKPLRFFNSIANRIISALATANPKLADRVWCYWVGGFDNIHIEAIKITKEMMREEERLRIEYHLDVGA